MTHQPTPIPDTRQKVVSALHSAGYLNTATPSNAEIYAAVDRAKHDKAEDALYRKLTGGTSKLTPNPTDPIYQKLFGNR